MPTSKNVKPLIASQCDIDRLIARIEVQDARMNAHFAALSVIAIAMESEEDRQRGIVHRILGEYRDRYREIARTTPESREGKSAVAVAQEMDAILSLLAGRAQPKLQLMHGGKE